MSRNLFPAERYKTLAMMRERNAYRDMAFTMQVALQAIADGKGDAQAIARQTLNTLNEEHGDGPKQIG